MHHTALKSGESFSASYGIPNGLVIDIGGEMLMVLCVRHLK